MVETAEQAAVFFWPLKGSVLFLDRHGSQCFVIKWLTLVVCYSWWYPQVLSERAYTPLVSIFFWQTRQHYCWLIPFKSVSWKRRKHTKFSWPPVNKQHGETEVQSKVLVMVGACFFQQGPLKLAFPSLFFFENPNHYTNTNHRWPFVFQNHVVIPGYFSSRMHECFFKKKRIPINTPTVDGWNPAITSWAWENIPLFTTGFIHPNGLTVVGNGQCMCGPLLRL